MRYFLELSYNGTDFHGWQRQLNAFSVQENIENAMKTILRKEIGIIGCGRTDTGVHAKQFYAHFDAEPGLIEPDFEYKLNAILPKSVAIHKALKMTDDAHARFSATSRSYEYCIHFEKEVFRTDLSWHFRQNLNISNMKRALDLFIGTKDFKAFCKHADEKDNHVCSITELKITENSNGLVVKISANRFLRNMVRAIVGTLVELGEGKLTINDLKEILEGKDRSKAGVSAPAKGLFLTNIQYPKHLFLDESS